jgi:hypothetical protein
MLFQVTYRKIKKDFFLGKLSEILEDKKSLMARIQRMEADLSAVNRCELRWTNRRGRYKRKNQ